MAEELNSTKVFVDSLEKDKDEIEKCSTLARLVQAVFAGDDEAADAIYKEALEKKYIEPITDWYKGEDEDEDETPYDGVKHPYHYIFGPMECFELIRAMEGDERAAGFAIGSCWKYMYRHNAKGQDLKDMGKVAQFAKMYIEVQRDILREHHETEEL